MTHRYGRKAPHNPLTHPRLLLGDFLHTAALPPIPATVDYLSKVPTWPMYLNDQLGCCTCAAAGHMIEAITRYGQGVTVTVSNNDVLHTYEAVSGYNPDDPSTDQGAVMQDVLGYWRKTGIGGHKILAFAQLDIKNPTEVQAALYLFSHIYVGLNVPKSAEDQFAAGQPWDAVQHDGGILGGHAVNVGAIDSPAKLRLVTWGAVQGMTKAFWDKYVEEAWVVIDQEWINANGSSPEGLDMRALGDAFTQLTGQPSPFPITPTPGPTPTPVPPAPGPVDPHVADDLALVSATSAFRRARHTGEAAKVSQALNTWMNKRGYVG